VKRYNLSIKSRFKPHDDLFMTFEPYPVAIENKEGNWVRYEDVKELILKNELLMQIVYPSQEWYSLAEVEPKEN